MTSLNTKTSSRQLHCCCGENSDELLKLIEHYQLITCHSCGLIRLSHIYSDPEAFLKDAVKDEGLEYWGFPEFYKKYKTIFDTFFEERYQRISKEIANEGEWLDIGSGYGFWQKFLEEKKQNSFGLEIEKKAFDFSLLSGIAIEHKSIEEFSSSKKYPAITMCDVLEHVENPKKILRKCHELLIPGGLIYIQVPNVLGFKYPFNDSLGLPHHLWQFDPITLIGLLKREKFEICAYWTGVQGVIRYYEMGGPGLYRKFMWRISKILKRGNMLQILARKCE